MFAGILFEDRDRPQRFGHAGQLHFLKNSGAANCHSDTVLDQSGTRNLYQNIKILLFNLRNPTTKSTLMEETCGYQYGVGTGSGVVRNSAFVLQ